MDSVCCNAACNSQCESCNEAGTAGTCTSVSGKPRGSRAACDALPESDCAKTTCDGIIRDKCGGYANGTTTACGADACTADKKVQKAGVCDGRGKCATPEPLPCTPYTREDAPTVRCKSSCAADADCSEGYTCLLETGSCIQGAKCNAERTASIDKTGVETLCAPYRCGTDGKCLSTCTSTEQCAPSSVCDPSSKSCIASAGASEDDGGCAYGAVAARVRCPASSYRCSQRSRSRAGPSRPSESACRHRRARARVAAPAAGGIAEIKYFGILSDSQNGSTPN